MVKSYQPPQLIRITLDPQHRQQTSDRKKDHIDLAFESKVAAPELDQRFYYEPLLSAHPRPGSWPAFSFLGKTQRTPLWISSMTGGTEKAGFINKNLAKVCNKFGFGMGLGSCRIILEDATYFEDFNLRPVLGDEVPFYANLGIAQVEYLLAENKVHLIRQLLQKLDADGLIVHVNPVQEWLQPEGDHISKAPLETLTQLLEVLDAKIIVKEVGQGFGPESLQALLQLPLAAIELAGNGGTNFAKLELLRSTGIRKESFANIPQLGHTAAEMVDWCNQAVAVASTPLPCTQLILSGGIQDFLDGYYLLRKSHLGAVYGQASAMLRHAQQGYESLEEYVALQVRGLEFAQAFLQIREQ